MRFRDDSVSLAFVAMLVGVTVLVGKSHGHQPQIVVSFADDVHVTSFDLFFFLLIFSP